MILFTILLIALVILATVAAIIALACGAGFVAVFGDAIICVLIIWVLVKLFRRRR